MIAKLENQVFNLYNEKSEIIGKIKINLKPHFSENEIIIGDKTFKIIRENWTFIIYENEEIIYNLKTNSFFGNITVLELNKKIKGVFSLKWGTQLVDEDNNSLLKIRNESQLVDKGNYVIEINDEKVSDFEILLSLFGHIYGSNLKTKTAIGATL
mgnify:CR=1 FL=1